MPIDITPKNLGYIFTQIFFAMSLFLLIIDKFYAFGFLGLAIAVWLLTLTVHLQNTTHGMNFVYQFIQILPIALVLQQIYVIFSQKSKFKGNFDDMVRNVLYVIYIFMLMQFGALFYVTRTAIQMGTGGLFNPVTAGLVVTAVIIGLYIFNAIFISVLQLQSQKANTDDVCDDRKTIERLSA